MLRKTLFSLAMLSLLVFPFNPGTQASDIAQNSSIGYEVVSDTLSVYFEPNTDSRQAFLVYRGMDIEPTDVLVEKDYRWLKFGRAGYWVPMIEPGGVVNIIQKREGRSTIIEDYYGILEQPHRYAVKLVKKPGAVAYMETYSKVGGEYILRHSYDVSYRREGQKDAYGDLKTVGGHVVRYLYRTTRSSMNGWNADGELFGVYKTSFPMPHDGLPHLLDGRISTFQYNKLPAINRHSNGVLYPHPGSYMGAYIVLHTKRKGSRGCLNIENEAMSYLYHEDLVTEPDREIIPLIIYDEDMIAPPVGELF